MIKDLSFNKKFLSIFISVILCISLFTAYAPERVYAATGDFTVGDLNYAYLGGSGGTDVALVGLGPSFSGTVLTVPPTAGGYNVTNIGNAAFWNTSITSVDLSNASNLMTIGSDAFGSCFSLDTLDLGSVETIGYLAFAYCSGLTDLTIPGSVTSIGGSAFGSCSNLDSLVISGDLDEIGANAFANCVGLSDVIIKGNVASIGNNAFGNCSNLSLIFSEDVDTICSNAFFACNSITDLVISEGVETIGDLAFAYCSGLTELTIPSSVTSIGGSAFGSCSNLERLVISGDLDEIGANAFANCSSLSDVLIKGNVASIGNNAFGDCSNLSLVFSEDVDTISDNAFFACNSLTNLDLGGVETIGEFAFAYCSGLTELTIPSSVTSIGGSAFGSCSNLERLVISNGVKEIGVNAFANCSDLTGKLTIPGSVNTLGFGAFANCSDLTGLALSKGVKEIGDNVFAYCSSLTGKLTIPSSVKSIGTSAFNGCSNLAGLVISEGVETIGDLAFAYCSSLTGDLTIPDSVKSIGNSAFGSCSKLTGLVIPNGIETIGDNAFSATGITYVDFSKATKALSVGAAAFNNSNLKTIKFGDSIPTNFAALAFSEIPNNGVVFYPRKAAATQYANFVKDYLTAQGVTGWILCETFSASPASIDASTVNVAIAPTNVASDIGGGTPGYKYVLKSGSVLPNGLTLNSSTGVVSGTPTQVTPAGKITVIVTDSGDGLLAQGTEIVVPYGAVTIADHSVIKNSHDKSLGGKDGLTSFGEDVVVEFLGDLKGKDGVATFVFNEKEYVLSSSSGETSISITDLTGANAGTITSGGVDAESLSLLATDDSITVTLPSAFADRLENGTHEMQVWFADSTAGDKSTAGVATIVVRREGNPKSPTIAPLYGGDAPKTGDTAKTGDDNAIALQLTLGGLSLLALLTLIAYRRRQTRLM
ncbi:MAG: leucine-rich repeat protein [Clostridiales Family XIII bacterium]|jgi:hypothetical protein|nr:leucine-rich repeat protein [Clostridiales Family XIII bacterium]